MGLVKFFNSIFSQSIINPLISTAIEIVPYENADLSTIIDEEELEERINVAKRTLIAKLYYLEQEITVFEEYFPEEYKMFLKRIEDVRQKYQFSLKEIEKLLTFEIDPETDSVRIREVEILEKEIKNFINSKVKFAIISKRLQQLILKLNILYSVSIFHYKESEKEKALSQTKRAIEKAVEIAKEFKVCDIAKNLHTRDQVISLLSYVDYQIFKLIVRNSDCNPEKVIENLILFNEFENFDYIGAFIPFIKEEGSDYFKEKVFLITSQGFCKNLKKKLSEIINTLTYSTDTRTLILSREFWNNFMEFETNLFQILKESGVSKESLRVKLITKMNIELEEADVLSSPISDSYVELIDIYSKTHDEKILALAKFIKNLQDSVAYKEIYFLVLLFDSLEIIKNTQSDLAKHVEKYLSKYPYSSQEVARKKEMVINSSNKEYVIIFVLKEHEREIIETLKSLNFDIIVKENRVYINSFYFKNLKNVAHSLNM